MVKSKITVNWFVDFDKEEKWLNEMAGKGWALKSTNGVLYRFNQCRPGEFIYQIDFNEKKSGTEAGDYVAFRSSCGDRFVYKCKSKIYWAREQASGPFESDDNIAAKLRLTNKAFQFHLNSFIGLTIIAAVSFLVLMPMGRHLPVSDFSYWLTEFSTGLTYGILLADILILLPILRKLNNKIKDLITQIF